MRKSWGYLLATLFTVLMVGTVATPAQAAVTGHWSGWKTVQVNTGLQARVYFDDYPAGGNYYRPTSYQIRYDGVSASSAAWKSSRLVWENLNNGDHQTINKNGTVWLDGSPTVSVPVGINQTLGYSNPEACVSLWTGTTAGTGIYQGGVCITP